MTRETTGQQDPGEVDRDVACLGCAYNLRGLSANGNCPECGWTVMRSLQGNLLRYADEHWVARMRRGVSMVYTSILVALLVITFGLVLFGALSVVELYWGGDRSFRWVLLVVGVALCAMPVLYSIAWWMATAQDPGEKVGVAWQRRVLRITAVVLFPAYVVWFRCRIWPVPGSPVSIEVISHLCFGTIWLHLVTMTGVLDRLHRRTAVTSDEDDRRDRARMRKAVRWALRAPVVFLAIHWVYGLVELAMSWQTGAPPLNGLGTGVGPILITLLWLSTIDSCRIVSRAAGNEQVLALSSGVSG